MRSKKQVLPPKTQFSEVDLTKGGQNFTYSKIQLWVALDRALRLADKRNLPCPNRMEWLNVRDTIYEEIMERGFNEEKKVEPTQFFLLDWRKDIYSVLWEQRSTWFRRVDYASSILYKSGRWKTYQHY